MAVTARDVAQRAGVSISTVSRALAKPQLVSPRTRDAVAGAAHELGYVPNPAARGLITGKTGNIGLLVPDLQNPFFAAIAKAVQSRARLAGYAIFIADTDEEVRLEGELVGQLSPQVDGLLLCSPRSTEAELTAMAARARVVLMNRVNGDMPAVTIDNADGMRQAVNHLRALGHHRIAYAGGPRNSWSDKERRVGLIAALDEIDDVEWVDLGHFPPYHSGGLQAADLAVASGASAVIVHNDLMALGIYERLHTRGMTIPDDMSVVGFDNIPVATMISPALTTVGVPLATLGHAAIDMLIARIESNEVTNHIHQLPVELMVRRSSAEAPTKSPAI